jgi:signal transduction histidine kinase
MRDAECLPSALLLIQSRLRQAQKAADNAPDRFEEAEQDFGEVLRHELNNPLTGILGNAKPLLAEVHRKNDGNLPHGGEKRLETIAALAVRLRETVRRLSQEWEARQHPVH